MSTAYASTNGIKVGPELTIDKANYKVVGPGQPHAHRRRLGHLLRSATLQSSATQASRINEVLVKVGEVRRCEHGGRGDQEGTSRRHRAHLQAARRSSDRQSLQRQETCVGSGRGPRDHHPRRRACDRRFAHAVQHRQAGTRDRHPPGRRDGPGDGWWPRSWRRWPGSGSSAPHWAYWSAWPCAGR